MAETNNLTINAAKSMLAAISKKTTAIHLGLLMTRKTQRKVHIDGEEYVWVANCDDLFLYPFKDMSIRVFRGKETKSILYIDANVWHYELTPRHIKDAIRYALLAGWQPSEADTSISLSKNENGYFVMSSNSD